MREVILHDGRVRLINADCCDVLPMIGKVDAVVTDPPYGIGADVGQASRANKRHGAAALPSTDYGESDWDSEPCSPELIAEMRAKSKWQIIFGGNYFALDPARCWLLWDKQNGTNDYADCEMAWTNLDKPVRRLYWLWHGMIRKGHEERVHPTQKPEGVMRWCIEQLPADVETILDPFAGSGSTGVAAVKMGKRFIGIEREASYFDIMVRRIEQALRQPDLFITPPTKPTQPDLLSAAT